MARIAFRFASSAAILASLSMVSAPAAAAAIPRGESAPAYAAQVAKGAVWSADSETANHRGRGGGWHRDRGGIDGGDVLAGVLILGGIAAIASAASKSDRQGDYRDDYPSGPYPDDRYQYRGSQRGYGSGIDNAVDICVDQVERGRDRVASVDGTSRTGDGWRVSGQLEAGGGFTCTIDNDGRIRNVDVGGYSGAYSGDHSGAPYPGSYSGAGSDDRQWNDDDYARARSQAGAPDPYPYEPAPGYFGG